MNIIRKNGLFHCTDGPAIEWKNGNKEWYLNGKRHREDGPAIEFTNGEVWYQNGKRHRTDGPAIVWASGEKFWYIDGNKYSFSEWCDKLNLSREEKCELALIYG